MTQNSLARLTAQDNTGDSKVGVLCTVQLYCQLIVYSQLSKHGDPPGNQNLRKPRISHTRRFSVFLGLKRIEIKMGNSVGRTMEDNLKKNQEFMLEMNR